MATQTAPGDLELLRGFVNTLDIEAGEDALVDLDAAVSWFRGHDLLAGPVVDPPSLTYVREIREAFRDLLHASSHGEDDEAARALLNEVAGRAGLHVRLEGASTVGTGTREAGILGALGQLVGIAVEAMREGTWQRLKVCDNDGCAWAFYDHSRNRSGRWCSMAVCGNRMKVRAYRERERDG